ncbi:MAG: heme-binding protein [Thiohalocapsa sp.]|nr:heme-binding protein [Thiohalocapsa sp.]MCF7992571.1 heme-binding protein [Thiohalocapsa sp.]
MAIEEPAFEVIETYPAFELRRYAPYLVAETEVTGNFGNAGNRGFRRLAGYIFGDNRGERKIEMTAPVNQRPADKQGQVIDMTAPVTQRPRADAEPNDAPDDAERFVISFVMPEQFTLETLPRPTDPTITFREVPERLMAVRRYSGTWSERNYRENERALLSALPAAGLSAVSEPVYARYNSPFSLWFLRRNEVMVEVERDGE